MAILNFETFSEQLLESVQPKSYEDALIQFAKENKTNWNTSSNEIWYSFKPNTIKFITDVNVKIEYNIGIDMLYINVTIYNSERFKFVGVSAFQTSLMSLLEKSGLKIKFVSVDGNTLTLKVDQRLNNKDLKDLPKIKKLITNLSDTNINKILKEHFGKFVSNKNLVEKLFKESKLKVTSEQSIGVFNEWIIKSKDVNSSYDNLCKAITSNGFISNSRSDGKITFMINFGKYILVQKREGELFVKTYE